MLFKDKKHTQEGQGLEKKLHMANKRDSENCQIKDFYQMYVSKTDIIELTGRSRKIVKTSI